VQENPLLPASGWNDSRFPAHPRAPHGSRSVPNPPIPWRVFLGCWCRHRPPLRGSYDRDEQVEDPPHIKGGGELADQKRLALGRHRAMDRLQPTQRRVGRKVLAARGPPPQRGGGTSRRGSRRGLGTNSIDTTGSRRCSRGRALTGPRSPGLRGRTWPPCALSGVGCSSRHGGRRARRSRWQILHVSPSNRWARGLREGVHSAASRARSG